MAPHGLVGPVLFGNGASKRKNNQKNWLNQAVDRDVSAADQYTKVWSGLEKDYDVWIFALCIFDDLIAPV